MTQFISLRVVGLGWPSRQKSHSSSPLIGNAPQLIETDCTPGVETTAASAARNEARMAAGLVCRVAGESEKPKGEASTDKQNQGDRHLHYSQNAVNTLARAARAAAALLQAVLQIGARDFERGKEAEKNSSKQRSCRSEKQHPQINVDFSGARQS